MKRKEKDLLGVSVFFYLMSVLQSVFLKPIKIQRVRGLGLVYFVLPCWSVDWLMKKLQAQVGVHTHL